MSNMIRFQQYVINNAILPSLTSLAGIKSVRKTIKRFFPSYTKLKVSFTGSKLSSRFNINDKTNFDHKHDVIYPGTCPETTYNDNHVGEAKRRIFERVKEHNGRDIKSSACPRKRFQNNW